MAEKKAEKFHSSLPPLTLLVTVVNRSKAEFYADLLADREANMQMIMAAHGTASSEMLDLLGLTQSDKAVIISAMRKDAANAALSVLEEKFGTVKNGKGIAFTTPVSSVIGTAIYRFLSNREG